MLSAAYDGGGYPWLGLIADDMLEHLPLASQVGKILVGGIDLNKARMRQSRDRFCC